MNAMPDLSAPIQPGLGAAGLVLGCLLAGLRQIERGALQPLGGGVELVDLGAVRVWAVEGAIHQIGLRGAYAGRVAGTTIGVGSTLEQVVGQLGSVSEGEDDVLIVRERPGLGFETEHWRGSPATLEQNMDARVTEIFVFAAR